MRARRVGMFVAVALLVACEGKAPRPEPATSGSAGSAGETEGTASTDAPAVRPVDARVGRPMTGTLEEIPLPDLLQLLGTSRKSGLLQVNNGVSAGKIYLRGGHLYFASLDDVASVGPLEAFYRMMTWSTGTFELVPSVDVKVGGEITQVIEVMIMEGLRHRDEFDELRRQLPPAGTRLGVSAKGASEPSGLSQGEATMLRLVRDHGALQRVLDLYPGSDVDAARSLITLLKRKLVVVR